MPRLKGGARPGRYSIFYVADIHGSEKCFRKFINAGKFYGVDALILGGDVTGKAFVPLVRLDDGAYEARFIGRTEFARNDDELARLESQIRFNGFYPFRTTTTELEDFAARPQRREAHFEKVIGDSVRAWVALADERLDGSGIACLVMPGNDDGSFVGEILSGGRVLQNPEGRPIELGPFQVLSYGWSNITPWHSPRELPESELEARIFALVADLEPGRPAIYNLHVPPYGTRIDDAPEIRADLSLVGVAHRRAQLDDLLGPQHVQARVLGRRGGGDEAQDAVADGFVGDRPAVGTPVVALFGPSNPAEWGPRGGAAEVIYKGLDCRTCFHPTCLRGEQNCMQLITIDEVIMAAARLLGLARLAIR